MFFRERTSYGSYSGSNRILGVVSRMAAGAEVHVSILETRRYATLLRMRSWNVR